MKIPKTVRLGGLQFTVHVIPAKEWKDEEAVGLFHPDSRTIAVLYDKNKETLLHRYLHELEHAILHVMNRDRLYKDEAFVDLHSCLLLQALLAK